MIATPARSRRFEHRRHSHSTGLLPHLRTLLIEGWRSVTGQPSLSISMGARSVTGCVRHNNEDRCFTDPDHGICLVADGVGGHRGGAEASDILMRVLPSRLAALTDSEWIDGDLVEDTLADAVEQARQEMIDLADTDSNLNRMGATMAVAMIVDRALYVCRVGDCRAYLLHHGRLQRLTKDQSFVQAAMDAGVLTEEAARTHRWRHVVTNTVGVKPLDEEIMVDEFEVAAGDRVLLCSDGLTGVVSDDELEDLLVMGLHPQETTNALVATALDHKSRDNVTCVVVDVCNCEAVTESTCDCPEAQVA